MNRNLTEWLQHLRKYYGMNRGGDLGPIKKIANKLKLNRFSCPVVTIAGTNGKGSCTAVLESILLQSGYKVATYTSPHLLRFNERIKINGCEAASAAICDALARVDSECKIYPMSIFAVITLAAFYIFQHQELDLLILEVGLGGRLDPVNIVEPSISVITTIALDHTDRLGSTREKIGFEKAGIMRPSTPLVCGEPNPPAVITDRVQQLACPSYFLNSDFHYFEHTDSWDWNSIAVELKNLPIPNLPLPSVATALMVLQLLSFKISEIAIRTGLRTVKLQGRMQTIATDPQIILDVAHNQESVTYLAAQLQRRQPSGKTVAAVGMLKNKNILQSLAGIHPLIDSWYCSELQAYRTASIEELTEVLRHLNTKKVATFSTLTAAFLQAVTDCNKVDRVVVFGSFYAVAEVLNARGNNNG